MDCVFLLINVATCMIKQFIEKKFCPLSTVRILYFILPNPLIHKIQPGNPSANLHRLVAAYRKLICLSQNFDFIKI